jgi:hypothetical protein
MGDRQVDADGLFESSGAAGRAAETSGSAGALDGPSGANASERLRRARGKAAYGRQRPQARRILQSRGNPNVWFNQHVTNKQVEASQGAAAATANSCPSLSQLALRSSLSFHVPLPISQQWPTLVCLKYKDLLMLVCMR